WDWAGSRLTSREAAFDHQAELADRAPDERAGEGGEEEHPRPQHELLPARRPPAVAATVDGRRWRRRERRTAITTAIAIRDAGALVLEHDPACLELVDVGGDRRAHLAASPILAAVARSFASV